MFYKENLMFLTCFQYKLYIIKYQGLVLVWCFSCKKNKMNTHTRWIQGKKLKLYGKLNDTQEVDFFLRNLSSFNHIFPLFQQNQLLLFPVCVFILRLNLIHPVVRTHFSAVPGCDGNLGSCVAKKQQLYLLFSAMRCS